VRPEPTLPSAIVAVDQMVDGADPFQDYRNLLTEARHRSTALSPIYMVDPNPRLAKSHPDWVIKNTLDLSKPEVVDYLTHALDGFNHAMESSNGVRTGVPTAYGGNETLLLGQTRASGSWLRNFLDQTSGDAFFQACNGGGNESRIPITPATHLDFFFRRWCRNIK